MSKILKKVFVVIISCVLAMSTFVGCTPSQNSSENSTGLTDSTGKPAEIEVLGIATTTSDLYGKAGYETDEKIIRGLHEAGFKYIDFSMYYFTEDSVYMQDGWETEVSNLKAVADELDMEFVQAHSVGTNPLSDIADEAEFVVEATIRSIEICEMLGIENIVVHAGWKDGVSKQTWFNENKAFYDKLLPTAQECGVNVLCENSTRKNMGDRYYLYTGSEMREFIEFVNHPNFHGCWDTGHANCEKNDQYQDIVALGDEMYAIHYTDNMGDADTHLLPFFGTLNHNSVMKALADIDYNGYFTLECDGGVNRTQNLYSGPEFSWMKELRPIVPVSQIPKYMTMIQQEKLLYDIAVYILESYPL